MKRQLITAFAVSLLLHTVHAQTNYLYTNVTSGATVDLSSDLTLSTDLASSTNAVGIGFSGGEGTLTGVGNVTVLNIATSSVAGATTLTGITGSTITNQYTGTLQVVNDLSAFSGAGDHLGFATGIEADVSGDLAGGVNVLVKGATYTEGGSSAFDYSITAHGVDGDIDGNVTKAVLVTATGGTAIGSLGGVGGATREVNSTATAINGSVGDVLANVTASAAGGRAKANNAHGSGKAYAITGNVNGNVDALVAASASGGELEGGLSFASGSATAEAIGSNVIGNVTGSIVSDAMGARAINGDDAIIYTKSDATALVGSLTGNLEGTIRATATGGSGETSTQSADADATATGIGGGMTSSNFSGRVEVAATGGTVGSSGSAHADATADGITGSAVSITGGTNAVVTVSATAGTVNGVENDGIATATGIASSGDLTLNLTSGNIIARAVGTTASATALSAGGAINLDLASGNIIAETNGAGATAISASSGSIAFGDVNVIGDIAGGASTLTVYGDTTIWGDILSSGTTTVSDDSSLTFLNPQATLGGNLSVNSNATLGVVLTPGDTSTAALAVAGSVSVEDAGKLTVRVPTASAGGSILGQKYLLVGSSSVLDEFEFAPTVFIMTITNESDGVWGTIDGVVAQTGASAPALANGIQSLMETGNGFIADVSSRAEGVRAILREPDTHIVVKVKPSGAAGPDTDQRRKIEEGGWVAYFQQVNHLGKQDKDGATAGYRLHSHGLLIGTEKLVGRKILIGAAAAGLQSRMDGVGSAQEGDAGLFVGSLYGDWVGEAWHVEAGLSYGGSSTDTERTDTGGETYRGGFDSSFFGGWLESGYSIFKESQIIEPYGRLVYLSSKHDGYTDEGGAAPLTVGDNSFDNMTSEFGVRVSKAWFRESHKDVARLNMKLGWRQELLDTKVTIDNAMLAGSPQVLESAERDRAALVLGIGGDWFVNDEITLGIDYEPVVSGNWSYHSFNVQLIWLF
ncbi:MAG: autotransporter domain-containing protein [Verrucomicrobiota bacterium]